MFVEAALAAVLLTVLYNTAEQAQDSGAESSLAQSLLGSSDMDHNEDTVSLSGSDASSSSLSGEESFCSTDCSSH
jgi:hypothetical protein